MNNLLLFLTQLFKYENNTIVNDLSLGEAIFIEAFLTIHVSIFVFVPLSKLIAKENSKKVFWSLFIIRAVFLIFADLFITTHVAFLDFALLFVGIILLIIISIKENVKIGNNLICKKCNAELRATDRFCQNCGEPTNLNNNVTNNIPINTPIPAKKAVLKSSFDSIYSLSESQMLEEYINRELTKANIDKNSKLIPNTELNRKKKLYIIFSILVFLFISSIFFHFQYKIYVIGIIILVVFLTITRNYNIMIYFKKEIKARPSEKISNIIMNSKNTFVTDNSKNILLIGLFLAIILSISIFYSPRIIYEKVDNGYAVRYYTFGLTNFTTANIPATYKNENVVTIRGNTFSNMPFLKSVKLPDTITEIRGRAFKNCYFLSEINIPENIEYLGGSAFYNAKSIRRIELPNSLTYMGGETFYGASSLEYIKLSDNLSEIRGNSFEECISLESIIIPDNITRIGGHAFYGDYNLSNVSISNNSKLKEIGSSAFRQCSNLYNINIPYDTNVNERAFKESPTTINRYNYDVNYRY